MGDVVLTNVSCHLCGSQENVVMLVPEGKWRCVDTMACLMRKPAAED